MLVIVDMFIQILQTTEIMTVFGEKKILWYELHEFCFIKLVFFPDKDCVQKN